MRVILEFEGNDADAIKNFEKAMFEMDEEFDLADSIIWELDYGDGESKHPTKYGDIIIKQQVS